MAPRAKNVSEAESRRIMLGVLSAVEDGGKVSQRSLATDLDVALGLVNAYVKRCVRKGYVKLSQAPARRYAYYLTPSGFSEKARLTAEYLGDSLSYFRNARRDYGLLCRKARALGWKRIALVGASDLAEIAAICAIEHDLTIVAVVDQKASSRTLLGAPIVGSTAKLDASVDGALLTALDPTLPWIRNFEQSLGADKLLSTKMLASRKPG